jgi:methylated-DNA-[protein]-cysteine S-methyltransferase
VATRPQTYQLFQTAFGTCGLAWTEIGLSRVQLPEQSETALELRLQQYGATRSNAEPPVIALKCMSLLHQYFDSAPIDFHSLVLDMQNVTDFNGRIYAALRTVAYGKTTTYGALALSVGSPGAAQAVGTAMARNPWPVVVPCHRVLAAAKHIGGFSAFGGTATKLRLLKLEGVDLDHGQSNLPGLFD